MCMWMWGVGVRVRVRVCGWVCTHDLLEGRHVGYLSSTERRDGAKERERMLRKDKLRKENEVCEIFLSRPWWLRWQVSIWVGGMVEVGEKGWQLGHSLRKLGWPHTANKPFGWLPSPHREVRIDSRRVDLRRVPGVGFSACRERGKNHPDF